MQPTVARCFTSYSNQLLIENNDLEWFFLQFSSAEAVYILSARFLVVRYSFILH